MSDKIKKIYYLEKVTSQKGISKVRVKGDKRKKEYENIGYKVIKTIEVKKNGV